MTGSSLTSATAFSPSLEAIKLAAQMYNAAREGNKQVLEEAIQDGLPPNLTNEKGDTLVSPLAVEIAAVPPARPLRGRTCAARVEIQGADGKRSSCWQRTTAMQMWSSFS